MRCDTIIQIKKACADIRTFCSENNILNIEDKMLFAQGFVEGFYRNSYCTKELSLDATIELFELGLNLSLKR